VLYHIKYETATSIEHHGFGLLLCSQNHDTASYLSQMNPLHPHTHTHTHTHTIYFVP